MKEVILVDNIYCCTYVLLIGCDSKSSSKWFKEHNIEASFIEEDWHGYCVTTEYKDRAMFVLLFNKRNKLEEIFNTVTHEVLHAVLHIMDYRSVKIDVNNSEPITYYMGWLNGEVLSEVYSYYEKINIRAREKNKRVGKDKKRINRKV